MNIFKFRKISNELIDLTRDSFEEVQAHYKKVPTRIKKRSILFLGTGQGTHNIASRGKASLPSYRLVSGPIISNHKSSIWIDPGPDCLSAMNTINFEPRYIDAIFLSHAHTDHIGNVLGAVELITGATEIKRKKFLYGNKTSIHGAEDVPSVIGDYHSKKILKHVQSLDVGDIIDLEDIKIEAIPCYHRETAYSNFSLNWKIEFLGAHAIISYVDGNIFIPRPDGDPSERIYDDVIYGCKGSNLLIVNVANHVRMRLSKQNYPSTAGLLELIKKLEPRVVFTTHFGIEMMNPNIIEKQLLKKYGFRNLIEFQTAYIQAEIDEREIDCTIVPALDFLEVSFKSNKIVLTHFDKIIKEIKLMK